MKYKTIIHMRSGKFYKHAWMNEDDAEEILRIVQDLKNLKYLTLRTRKDMTSFHPEDISYIQILKGRNWFSRLLIDLFGS